MAKIENENKKMVQLFQLPQPLDVLWKKQPNTDYGLLHLGENSMYLSFGILWAIWLRKMVLEGKVPTFILTSKS